MLKLRGVPLSISMKGKIMTSEKTNKVQPPKAAVIEAPYEVIYFAKKHRISQEDARGIIEKYGANRKEADKAGRRISV
ncbi:hypothetical protein GGQ65_002400 [Rhizobium fabae]|uniref:DUF3606 domain-containing protein n=3 Tax=Rhizobium TaxID=379 RepID=A0A7W6B3W1_9HYPH|nr:hypothetical protein [Rhizobium fabae]